MVEKESSDRAYLPHLLVVGGSGFIGQHVVNRALALGWSVVSLGLTAHPANVTAESLNYIQADIADKNSLKQALLGYEFDYVVNCGGYIDHTLFSQGGRQIIGAHFLGVMNLVEVLNRDHLKAFINIGSSDEYGNLPSPQQEDYREAPISPYSLGKLAATQFLQMLWRTELFPATTLRLFLTYGPGQDYQRFLPQIIRACLRGDSFPVSAGEQLRDFCYVEDTVDAIFVCMQQERARGEVINIGSGDALTIRQLIEKVVNMVGAGQPRYGELAYRPGENMVLYADTKRARSLLGWRSSTPLIEGLQKTIDWIKSKE